MLLHALTLAATAAVLLQAAPPPAANPDAHYQLGPDSFPQAGVPRGEVKGPFTLPSDAYPGTQHTYWVYVPAQYDAKAAASLMVFNDGQAFTYMDGDVRAPNVLDNLIYRREIPVMIAVFINPGRRPDQPEPTPSNWGDRDTNRPTEYNTLDDRYARVIVDELLPVLKKEYNLSSDPDRRGIGGASSGAIAAFTVAWQRPNEFRKVLSIVGSFTNLRGGDAYAQMVRDGERKPLRVYLQDGRNDNRGVNAATNAYDARRDWFLQNVTLMQALADKGYDLNYTWGIGRHGQKQGGAIFPDMMRWLWRDQPVSTDPNDAVERAFNAPPSAPANGAADPAVAELTRLEGVWNDAHVRGDADALTALWTDDLTVTVPGMPLLTKADAVAVARSGRMRFDRYQSSQIKVRVFNGGAIVTGRLQRSRTIDGKTAEDDWQFTKTYVRTQGKWLVAAFHASSAP